MNKHTPKKKWGQNFLIDSNTINKIVSSIDFTKNDRLLEIGPGKGAITKKLGENAKSLTAIEIDSKLSNILKKDCKKNIEIINDDFMKIDLENIDANIIVGNLPYYITTPILFKIFGVILSSGTRHSVQVFLANLWAIISVQAAEIK